MAKITLNNTNSKCPYCEIKEYVNACMQFISHLRAGSFLIELARKKVFEEFGINLENEVIII